MSDFDDETVIASAAAAGFRLVQYETDAGQLVWEWRRGDESRPQFVTRRVAIHWMTELLARERTVLFVSDVGLSYARHSSGQEVTSTHPTVNQKSPEVVQETLYDDSTPDQTRS